MKSYFENFYDDIQIKEIMKEVEIFRKTASSDFKDEIKNAVEMDEEQMQHFLIQRYAKKEDLEFELDVAPEKTFIDPFAEKRKGRNRKKKKNIAEDVQDVRLEDEDYDKE